MLIQGDEKMGKPKLKKLLCFLQAGLTACMIIGGNNFVHAATTAKNFSVLTLNVAGLPEPLSSSKPSVNTAKISPLLNGYDIVAVQEDFAYHNDLIKSVTHPYLTTTSGNVPFGDGMNFISKVPFL